MAQKYVFFRNMKCVCAFHIVAKGIPAKTNMIHKDISGDDRCADFFLLTMDKLFCYVTEFCPSYNQSITTITFNGDETAFLDDSTINSQLTGVVISYEETSREASPRRTGADKSLKGPKGLIFITAGYDLRNTATNKYCLQGRTCDVRKKSFPRSAAIIRQRKNHSRAARRLFVSEKIIPAQRGDYSSAKKSFPRSAAIIRQRKNHSRAARRLFVGVKRKFLSCT
jgi:hypothetical protein